MQLSQARRVIDLFRAVDIPRLYKALFESYHHDSDLLAELLQNAVDSIRMANPKIPRVDISFDEVEKRVSVRDTGLGMSEGDLEGFALGRTDKSGPQFSHLGGEKGLGAAFILGGSDDILIDSCKEGKRIVAECKGAFDSISKDDKPDFYVISEDELKSENYTEITVRGPKFFLDFGNPDELVKMIRLFTAVGYTKSLFGAAPLNIDVYVTWRAAGGAETRIKIPSQFLHPITEVPDRIVEFEDAPNVDNGYGKLLHYQDNSEEICAVFGERSIFDELGLEPGIYLSTKGYPTSVNIAPPQTSYALYWLDVFMLINDDQCRLDAGRKSVTAEDARRIRKKAKQAFDKLTKFHKAFIKTTESETQKAVLDSLKEDARQLARLGIEGISYQRVPDYEQAVVAIFHELIGAKRLCGYHTLSCSSDTPYDAVILYEVPLETLGSKVRDAFLKARRNVKQKTDTYRQTILAEFKLRGNEIIRDKKKDLKHLDLLIAYDFDTNALRKGWDLRLLTEEEMLYHGARHKLFNPTQDSCYVLLLKDFVDSK